MFRFLLSCFHFLTFFFTSQFHYHTELGGHITPAPTPTVIAATPTITPTPSIEITATPTSSVTIMITPTITMTLTPTVTLTETPTVTPTTQPSITLTDTSSPTITPTPTTHPSPTPTSTVSPSPTLTPTQTFTPSPVPTATPNEIPSPTPTVTPTMKPSPTPTMTPMPTVTLTPTTAPSLTPTSTITETVTPTSTPVETPSPTLTPDPTASPTPTFTPTPTASPSPTETPTLTPTITDTPTPTITKIGNDISYPQCNKTLPTQQGFGIVGVNGGLASTTNPCLGTELLWANLSLGTMNQSKVQLYVNTGNPGEVKPASWPTNNIDWLGNVAPNPYGSCDNSDSLACAWQYGWNRAVEDVRSRFVPAAQAVGVNTVPSGYPWWLDVETTNSWESGSDAALERNRADLEAMVTYFQSQGITVGIYATSYQWNNIVGSVPSGSKLNGLRSWLPGASDLTEAQSNCLLGSLTSGGTVALTQYSTSEFDYDYSCL